MRKLSILSVLITFWCVSVSSLAGVEIAGTRVIYNASDSQATISVYNPDSRPYLIQSWVARDVDSLDNDETFITTPPLFRLEPKSQNSVRIVLKRPPQINNKESVYWLNIKSIPATDKPQSNVLYIAVKNRMKLFYRPQGLQGNSNSAYQELNVIRRGSQLFLRNPTSYSVSFFDFRINGRKLDAITMILPGQELPVAQSPASATITWRSINDMGGLNEMQSRTGQ